MAVKDKEDVRDDIMAYLSKEERSLLWLSNKTKINYNTMYSIFKQRLSMLSDEKLKIINKKLRTDFKKA